MCDWSTIIDLLTKESEDLISTALRDSQVSILLHLFVTSAKTLKQSLTTGNQVEKGMDDKLPAKKSKLITMTQQSAQSSWDALNDLLKRKLPPLFNRFKDNEANLTALAELLDLCDFSGKGLQDMMKVSFDLFRMSSSDKLQRKLVSAFRVWIQGGGPASGVAEDGVKQLVVSQWTAMQTAAVSAQKAAKQPQSRGRASNGSSKKRPSSAQVPLHYNVQL